LFLDEPTTGVDPVSRKEFWEMLKRLQAQNITILVSTPYMDEATLCDRIALIQEGRILSIDTPGNIVSAYPNRLYAIRAGNMATLLKVLKDAPGILNSYAFGEYAHASFHNAPDMRLLENYLWSKGLEDTEIKPVTPAIEDCFIKLLRK